MAPRKSKHRFRRTWTAWLLFSLLCAGFAAFELGVGVAGRRLDLIEFNTSMRAAALTTRLSPYAYRDEIPNLEKDFNSGQPLPRTRVDLAAGRAERITLAGERVDRTFAGWTAQIDYSLTPGVFWNRPRAIPPRGGPMWVRRLGSAGMRRVAEQLRWLVLILCAAVWCVAIAPAAVAGPARRGLAQVALAASLLALLAWAVSDERLAAWALPPWNWVAAAAFGSLLAACIVALVPVRRRPRPADRCAHCGYNLTGNLSGICPECGRPTPEELRRRRDAELAPIAQAIGDVRVEPGDELETD